MKKSEKFWDRVSIASSKKLSRIALKTVEGASGYLNKSDLVLDFGCGPGTITNELAKYVRFIHAIDFSAGMLKIAKKETEEKKIKNINYFNASVFDEAFKEGSFDVVVAFNVLHYQENLPEVIQRISALLKPGGLFISSTACLKERKGIIQVLMYILSKTRLIPKTMFYKVSELKNAISQGSFIILKVEKLTNLPECFIVGRKDSDKNWQ